MNPTIILRISVKARLNGAILASYLTRGRLSAPKAILRTRIGVLTVQTLLKAISVFGMVLTLRMKNS
jgi:hypothetical protein